MPWIEPPCNKNAGNSDTDQPDGAISMESDLLRAALASAMSASGRGTFGEILRRQILSSRLYFDCDPPHETPVTEGHTDFWGLLPVENPHWAPMTTTTASDAQTDALAGIRPSIWTYQTWLKVSVPNTLASGAQFRLKCDDDPEHDAAAQILRDLCKVEDEAGEDDRIHSIIETSRPTTPPASSQIRQVGDVHSNEGANFTRRITTYQTDLGLRPFDSKEGFSEWEPLVVNAGCALVVVQEEIFESPAAAISA